MSIEGKFVLNKMMIIEVMGLLSKMLSSLITLPPFKVPTQDRRRPLSLTDSLLVCSITIVAAGINNLLLDGTKAINGTGNSGAIRCRINVFITGMGAEMIQLPNSLTSRPVG